MYAHGAGGGGLRSSPSDCSTVAVASCNSIAQSHNSHACAAVTGRLSASAATSAAILLTSSKLLPLSFRLPPLRAVFWDSRGGGFPPPPSEPPSPSQQLALLGDTGGTVVACLTRLAPAASTSGGRSRDMGTPLAGGTRLPPEPRPSTRCSGGCMPCSAPRRPRCQNLHPPEGARCPPIFQRPRPGAPCSTLAARGGICPPRCPRTPPLRSTAGRRPPARSEHRGHILTRRRCAAAVGNM